MIVDRYRTTVRQALDRLEDVGLTLRFFAGIFDTLKPSIDAKIADLLGGLATLGEWISPEGMADEGRRLLEAADELDADAHLDAFLEFMRNAIAASPLPSYIEATPGETPGVRILAADMAADLLINPDSAIDAPVARVAALFADDSDCPVEIQDLLLVRLSMELVASDARVELDLTDFWDEVEGPDLSREPTRLAQQLATKVELYNQTFAALMRHDSDLGKAISTQRLRDSLQALDRAVSGPDRGRSLEALIATIFESNPSFVVVDRAVRLGDEEIDLVVRNHVVDPFWQALTSPLILVECKNWTAPVGTKEIRDFEAKLRDHPLAKLGIFVALNGFTSQVRNALLRAQREGYHICLISRPSIEKLIEEGEDVTAWLAAEISELR